MKIILLKTLFFASFSVFMTSCCSQKLYVTQEAISSKTLASTHVNTPDYRHEENPIGQRLFVSWKLPSKLVKDKKLSAVLKVRYCNGEEQKNIVFPVKTRRGHYIFSLLNEDYFEKGGIMTYKIHVEKDGVLLKEWEHQLWAELITFN